MGIRLNKYIADSGICSRRKADELIEQKRVRINDDIAEQGMQVEENDIVYVDDKKISSEEKDTICVLLHKPIQVVSTANDPEGRTTVLDLIAEEYSDYRLYPVGRLDYFSEGLILLTNDGEIAHTFMHPSFDLERVYRVRLRKDVRDDIHSLLAIMHKGMTLEDGTQLAPIKTKLFNERTQRNRASEYDLEFTLHQGVNRQIRRMCSELGLTVLRLMRVSHGPLKLDNLAKGEFRQLTDDEVVELKKSVY